MKEPGFFKSAYLCSICLLISTLALASNKDSLEWNKIVKEQYTLHYTITDKHKINRIDNNLQSGIGFISDFFKQSFLKKFDVYIFPDRASLDKQWQKEWGDSTFQSQC